VLPSTLGAVCFDMDGVLIQSREVITYAWASVAHEYGIRVSESCIQEHIHGRPGSHTLSVLFGQYAESERQIIKQRVDAIEETSLCQLVPGVREILQALARFKVPVALVTSSWPARIAHVLDQHGLERTFSTVVCRDDVTQGKPDPACYRIAAARLRVPIENCLVFEDSQSGAKAAISAGAQCLGIGDDASLIDLGARGLYRDFYALLSVFEDDLAKRQAWGNAS